MIQANELRIGNILNYTTAENDIMPAILDWQDLKWASEDVKGFNLVHDAIPLTEEILLKCGFDKHSVTGWFMDKPRNITIDLEKGLVYFNGNIVFKNLKQLKHLHQLQNLYFALTGKELEVKL